MRNQHLFLATLLAGLFVTCSAHAWTITSDFEQGTIGAQAEGLSGFTDGFTQTLYSADMANSGKKSAKVTFSQGSDTFAQSGAGLNFPTTLGEGAELWARGYFYFKSPWAWTCSPVIKIFRGAHVQTSSGANVGYLSVFADSNGTILLSNEAGDTQPSTSAKFDIGTWQSIEMYVKFSATAPIFRIWKNGQLLIEDTTHKTLRSSTDRADMSYIFSYWNGGVPRTRLRIWMISPIRLTDPQPGMPKATT